MKEVLIFYKNALDIINEDIKDDRYICVKLIKSILTVDTVSMLQTTFKHLKAQTNTYLVLCKAVQVYTTFTLPNEHFFVFKLYNVFINSLHVEGLARITFCELEVI